MTISVRAFALAISLIGAEASAQVPTPAPPATTPAPSAVCPPCGPNDRCVDGVCLPNLEAPPPPAPPAEAPPPAPAAVPPPPVEPRAQPQPAPKRRAPPPKPSRDEDDDDDDDDEASPPPTLAWRRGMLVAPFAGLHAVEGIAANDYDAGFRFGVLLGVHVLPSISLNVELSMDLLNPTNAETSNRSSATGRDFTVAFNPLFHASAGVGEFVVGPKVGFWTSGVEAQSVEGTGTDQFSEAGWAFGFTMGGFAGITDTVALGALFSYQMIDLNQSCSRSAALGNSCSNEGFVPQILSFSVAALF